MMNMMKYNSIRFVNGVIKAEVVIEPLDIERLLHLTKKEAVIVTIAGGRHIDNNLHIIHGDDSYYAQTQDNSFSVGIGGHERTRDFINNYINAEERS